MPTKALADVRVVDFTRNVAGAYTTRQMGDLGADVLKIEPPYEGDMIRQQPPLEYAKVLMGGYFAQMNSSKRGLAVDLQRNEGREIIHELVKVSDVVVNNFTPGTMERLGLGYDILSRINPTLVMCSISAYGQYGPHRERRGAEYDIEAVTGTMHMTGEPEGPPTWLGEAFCDMTTSLTAFGAIMAALHYRDLTGLGQFLDIAMHDAVVAVNVWSINAYLRGKGGFKPKRYGHFRMDQPIVGLFKGRDGWIQIGASTDFAFGQLCEAMERPDLATAETFGTYEARWTKDKSHDLYKLVGDWVNSFASVKEVEAILNKRRVLATVVRTIEEVVTDPNIEVRGLLSTWVHPVLGKLKVQNTALKLSRTPPQIQRPPPRLGEHTKEVLETLLGYAPQRIGELFLQEVVWAEEDLQAQFLESFG